MEVEKGSLKTNLVAGRVMRLTKFGGTVFALLAPYAQHDWGICI